MGFSNAQVKLKKEPKLKCATQRKMKDEKVMTK
jgi:hypothetical protein